MRDETNKQIHRPSCLILNGGVISLTSANTPQAVRHDIHTCGSMGYGNCGSSTYQGAVAPREEWINYHGAIASNGKGNRGIAENARSERAARREALQKCGARDCKIISFTRNGCLAVASDGKNGGFGAEGTKQAAEAEAMRICQADGSVCEIAYSHCNHPVRIK